MAGGVVLGGHDCCKRGLKGGGGRDEANFFALPRAGHGLLPTENTGTTVAGASFLRTLAT